MTRAALFALLREDPFDMPIPVAPPLWWGLEPALTLAEQMGHVKAATGLSRTHAWVLVHFLGRPGWPYDADTVARWIDRLHPGRGGAARAYTAISAIRPVIAPDRRITMLRGLGYRLVERPGARPFW